MTESPEEEDGIEAEVIQAFMQLERAREQSAAAEQISKSGLASCGGESGAFVREAQTEAADAMKAATERVSRAQEAYRGKFGQDYESPKPMVDPPGARQKPDQRPTAKAPKQTKRRTNSRRRGPR